MESRNKGLTEGRIDRSSDQERDDKADEIRFQTLTTLEVLLRALMERYGARMTVGELLSITAAMAMLCKRDQINIGEIAEATGISKQNISRWMRKRIGDSIVLKINEEDQRMHDVVLLDRERGQGFIEQMADLLGKQDHK